MTKGEALAPEIKDAKNVELPHTEINVYRAIGTLLEDSLERLANLEKLDDLDDEQQQEEAEILYWIFIDKNGTNAPFEECCRLFGHSAERYREGILQRYPNLEKKIEEAKTVYYDPQSRLDLE